MSVQRIRLAVTALVLSCSSVAAQTHPPLPPALANGSRASREGVPLHVSVRPSPASVGQKLAYRGAAVVEPGVRVHYVRPKSGGSFTWSDMRIRRVPFASQGADQWEGRDSVVFEASLQVFDTGAIAIPGPQLRLDGVSWNTRPFMTRLPTASVIILSTITAADSAAGFRGLRGPLTAPWWERISWSRIAAGLLALAALLLFVRILRRRRPVPVASRPRPTAARTRRDAATEALDALAALRLEQWPEKGRYDQHAFELTRILRRYLEATFIVPRPGDTSEELVERLRQSRNAEDQVARLAGLLGVWDRLKFARAASSLPEAHASESAVEDVVERTRGAGRAT